MAKILKQILSAVETQNNLIEFQNKLLSDYILKENCGGEDQIKSHMVAVKNMVLDHPAIGADPKTKALITKLFASLV